MSIKFHNVHHPGVTYGYRVEVAGKHIAYVSDNEVAYLRTSIERRADEFDDEEHHILASIEREERLSEIAAVKGADILIHDAQYTPRDYERKRGWGHSCYVDTVNFAIDAGVKALYLYHHDPTYDDAKVDEIHRDCERLVEARGAALECVVAREGMVVEI